VSTIMLFHKFLVRPCQLATGIGNGMYRCVTALLTVGNAGTKLFTPSFSAAQWTEKDHKDISSIRAFTM
jgi:hypothetical protein